MDVIMSELLLWRSGMNIPGIPSIPQGMAEKRAYFHARGLVYVRSYWRAPPGFAWLGIKSVFVIEHLRRLPRRIRREFQFRM